MCKFKCLRILLFYTTKMLKGIIKRLINVSVCKLLCCSAVFLFGLVVWTYDSASEKNVPNATRFPAIIWWTEDFPGRSDTIECPNEITCLVYNDRKMAKTFEIEAYLFYASGIHFDDLPLPRRPRDVIWGLFHEESPRNVEALLHERILKLFNFSSTFSRFSDVPFPLQHLHSFDDITSKKYFVETSLKNEYLSDLSPILYLQSDCETSTERDVYVKELMKFVQVDSYGGCLKNKELPPKFKVDYLNHLNEHEFLKFIARYKFVIAIENGVCNDYVTEKFWRAIKVGNVPIYFGSPLIRDWLPNNKSAILLEDFPSPKILYQYIKKLLDNDMLYEEYLDHKTKQLISNNILKNEYKTRSYQLDGLQNVMKLECLVCKKLYDKRNGETEVSVVDKRHYDCPKPISALTLDVNPQNSWVSSWEYSEKKSQEIYETVMNAD